MYKSVTDILETEISGVRVKKIEQAEVLQKEYFEWRRFPIETMLKQNKVVSGLLQGWHRTVSFDTVEYHEDAENFYFFQGECIMIFGERKNNKVDMESIQLVKISAGTQVEVEAGKCHYVPIPLTDTFQAFVFTPLQDSVLCFLDETILPEEF